MVYITPFSTPTATTTATSETPLQPQTNDSSPWSEISMENWRNGVDFRSPPPLYDEAVPETPHRFLKAPLESLHRAIWLTVLIMICFWFWLSQQQQQIHFHRYNANISKTAPALDGLQFIDASHPYIRVSPAHTYARTKLCLQNIVCGAMVFDTEWNEKRWIFSRFTLPLPLESHF